VKEQGGWKNTGWDGFDKGWTRLVSRHHIADQYRIDTLDGLTVLTPLH